jgi:hypothetical protein
MTERYGGLTAAEGYATKWNKKLEATQKIRMSSAVDQESVDEVYIYIYIFMCFYICIYIFIYVFIYICILYISYLYIYIHIHMNRRL